MSRSEDTVTPAAAPAAAPVTPITETPEFKKAVAEQFSEFRAQLLSELKLGMVAAPPPDPDQVNNLDSVINKLALAIGVVSDQGTQRKRIAPEELDARAKANTRMGKLLEKAQSLTGVDRPRYKLVGKFYAGNRIIEPFQRQQNRSITQTEIFYLGIPNEIMRPVNDVATAIFAEYIRSLGGSKEVNGMAQATPVWMTDRGVVIANSKVPQTVAAHGEAFSADPIYVDDRGDFPATTDGIGSGEPVVEITSTTDPRAHKIPVLGNIHPPATVGGTSPQVAR